MQKCDIKMMALVTPITSTIGDSLKTPVDKLSSLYHFLQALSRANNSDFKHSTSPLR